MKAIAHIGHFYRHILTRNKTIIGIILILSVAGTGVHAYHTHHTSHEPNIPNPQEAPRPKTTPSQQVNTLNQALETDKPSATEESQTTNNNTVNANPSTNHSSEILRSRPKPLPGADSGPVTPNPYCPAPRFSLSVTRAIDSYNLYISVIPDYINPSNTPECGGVGYNTPTVTYPTNGNLCSGLLYPTSYMSWGMACSIYGGASYGDYTFGFTVTASNGFNITSTQTASYTIHYQPE
jgi:hypothetical protein